MNPFLDEAGRRAEAEATLEPTAPGSSPPPAADEPVDSAAEEVLVDEPFFVVDESVESSVEVESSVAAEESAVVVEWEAHRACLVPRFLLALARGARATGASLVLTLLFLRARDERRWWTAWLAEGGWAMADRAKAAREAMASRRTIV